MSLSGRTSGGQVDRVSRTGSAAPEDAPHAKDSPQTRISTRLISLFRMGQLVPKMDTHICRPAEESMNYFGMGCGGAAAWRPSSPYTGACDPSPSAATSNHNPSMPAADWDESSSGRVRQGFLFFYVLPVLQNLLPQRNVHFFLNLTAVKEPWNFESCATSTLLRNARQTF